MNQGGNMERAAEWILNHPEESVAMELDVGTGTHETQSEVQLPDGSGSKSQVLKDLKYSRHTLLQLYELCSQIT